MSTNEPKNIYVLLPPGDRNHRPLHLAYSSGSAPYNSRNDPVHRLPTPQVLAPLPTLGDPRLYERVFTVPWIDVPKSYDRGGLQAWGDEVFEWMIQCVIHQEYGYITSRYFDFGAEEQVVYSMLSEEQATYFAYLYNFDSLLRPMNTLTTAEKERNLVATFYAYLGAVEFSRGREVSLRWIRDLIKPILEYHIHDITKEWPKKQLSLAQSMWDADRQFKDHLHPDFDIYKKDYEEEDAFQWRFPFYRIEFRDWLEEIVASVLTNMRRRLRNHAERHKNLPLECSCSFSAEENKWTFAIQYGGQKHLGTNEKRRIAEYDAVVRAIDNISGPDFFRSWY
ncbi:hypothetical protein TWF694_008290 [Orbilia ellipsospora]|uniref:RNase III domain-containing protein n=1 Tax=Orbilia ellipsospora TaxID=2528407 RepID=A0AAV9XH67_9PEZI